MTSPRGAGYQPSTTSNAYQLPSDTARSNLASSPYNIQLSELVNQTNRAAQSAANAARLGPQGQEVQKTLLTNAQREAEGLLDPETEQMLRAGIAERGGASGMGVDSPNLASAYRRALGLDITATEAAGQQQYLGLLAANPSAPIYSPSSGFITPGQYASVAEAQAAASAPAPVSVSRGGGGGGGGGRYIPSAAEYNTVPYGGGYPGAGGVAQDQTDDIWDWAASLGYDPSMVGQGSIAPATTSTGTTGNLADLGFGEWYDPTLV